MRARVESRLAVVEDAAGDCERADAAERRMIEGLRQMGHEALTAWAERGVEKRTRVATEEPDWRPGGKKREFRKLFIVSQNLKLISRQIQRGLAGLMGVGH